LRAGLEDGGDRPAPRHRFDDDGFTSDTIGELQDSLGAWAAAGFRSV